ncbi:helicase-primase primase subunit [Falconid herpesvirus 1]|uniref:Helicase-primase primase subunit n=1 Tax=Falconid herpesvirus 1 TaxID=1510155 RepID=A0A068EW07_9ALPH|nr:helicase-primase primase subunit [Falconid herpesvirus 1]AID52759.1 helicase-primase primase subunit [Falconid herpesvirus 1]
MAEDDVYGRSLEYDVVDVDDVEPCIKVLFAVDGCAVSFSLRLLADLTVGGVLYVISYWDESGSVERYLALEGSRDDAAENGPETARESEEKSDGCASYTAGHRQAPRLHLPTTQKVEFCLLDQMTSGEGGVGPKARTRTIFVCRFTSDAALGALYTALTRGEPLPVEVLRETLDDEATYALHNDFNIALCAAIGDITPRKGKTTKTATVAGPDMVSLKTMVRNFPLGRRGMASLYIQHEQRVVAAYRRAYGGSTSTAFWYVSKFGPGEKTLVLATRYYLLQAQDAPSGVGTGYDLQAIKDLCLTYDVSVCPNPTGFCPADLTSFARLSRFCCSSGYARGTVAAWFGEYIERRILADVSEVGALREFIERDRSGLRISDDDFIKYVYLAHFECYNREQLKRHLRAVTVTTPTESIHGRSSLGTYAINEFFTHVRAQLNIEHYVECNVRPVVVEIDETLARLYIAARAYCAEATRRDMPVVGVYECATQLTKRLSKVEAALEKHGWPSLSMQQANRNCSLSQDGGCPETPTEVPSDLSGQVRTGGKEPANADSRPMIVKRLLAMISADVRPDLTSVGAILTGAPSLRGPAPIYRTAMAHGRQAFGAVVSDAWWRSIPEPAKAVALLDALDLSGIDDAAEKDAVVTLELGRGLAGDVSDPPRLAGGSVGDQKYVNRNEIFNANLAVGHIILDLDMHLRMCVPRRVLHTAARGLRRGALTALRLVMPDATVNWATHPCYFYKSECPRKRDAEEPEFGNWEAGLCEAERMERAWAGHDDSSGWTEPQSCQDPYDDFMDDSAFWDAFNAPEAAPTAPPQGDAHRSPSRRDIELPCNCERKIGMRVSIPTPRPYVLSGARTLSGLARVIQQAVLLERTFVEAIGPYLKDYDLVDIGVYGHGRSLRLPFFSKIADDGSVGNRFAPFYVIPDGCEDVKAFVAAHFEPRNFHFHSTSPDNELPRIIMSELGGDYTSFFDKKTAINRDRYFGRKPTLAATLSEIGLYPNEPASVEEFVNTTVLTGISSYMDAHFQEHAREYKDIVSSCKVLRSDWILLQLLPSRSLYGRQGFTCVRYKHSRAASRESVRTFLALSVDAHGRLCASLSQQCFATKCGNNKLRTLFTIDVGGQ